MVFLRFLSLVQYSFQTNESSLPALHSCITDESTLSISSFFRSQPSVINSQLSQLAILLFNSHFAQLLLAFLFNYLTSCSAHSPPLSWSHYWISLPLTVVYIGLLIQCIVMPNASDEQFPFILMPILLNNKILFDENVHYDLILWNLGCQAKNWGTFGIQCLHENKCSLSLF